MATPTFDETASGYLSDAFEGISNSFTEVEILNTSDTHVVAKAKRYGRWWLLKGLTQEAADNSALQQQLRKELEILIQLQHHLVVAAYALEEVPTLGTCIVMDYVEGQTLAEWLQGQTTQGQRRRVASELTEAVAYLHSKGIAHRDLKPGNILITRNGETVKLIDFGLADTDSFAVLKQPAGTMIYMSPEQMQTAVADSRNDIYSLGIIFSKMQLGMTYGSLIRKCQRPIEQRFQHIGELQRRMNRCERLPRRISITLLVLLFMALTTWAVSLQLREPQASALTASQIQQQEAQRRQLAAMTDSLEQLKKTNEQMKGRLEAQEQQRQRVETAISKGYELIDQAHRSSKLEEHLDTVSHINYLCDDFLSRALASSRAIETYCQQIEHQFSAAEMAAIRNSLMLYDADYQKKWDQRLEKISR